MSLRRIVLRLIASVAIVSACFVSPVAAQQAQPAQPIQQMAPGAASPLPADATWVFNLDALPERSAPDEASDPIANLRQFTYLAVTGYQGDWAQVSNPRTRTTGFVPSDEIGPTDPPPAYVIAEPPPAVDEVNMDG